MANTNGVGGYPVIVHYADIPETDITSLRGIRCTTPLRTVIDVAPEVGREHLALMVRHCLDRGLFTIDEALERLAEPDMKARCGAAMLHEILSEPGTSA